MIDYQVLCQSIEDWRAGRRPTAAIPGPTPAAPSAAYENVDSGLVEMDDEDLPVEVEADAGAYGDDAGGYPEPGESQPDDGYAEPQYGSNDDYGAEGSEAGAPAEPMGPTGTPPAFPADGPPPYDAGQPAPYTEMIPTSEESADVLVVDDDDETHIP